MSRVDIILTWPIVALSTVKIREGHLTLSFSSVSNQETTFLQKRCLLCYWKKEICFCFWARLLFKHVYLICGFLIHQVYPLQPLWIHLFGGTINVSGRENSCKDISTVYSHLTLFVNLRLMCICAFRPFYFPYRYLYALCNNARYVSSKFP